MPQVGSPAAPSPEQLRVLAAAQARARKVYRAARVASFSGWTTAILSAGTLIGAILDPMALPLGFALAIIAWVELHGAAELRRFEAVAPGRLALNQVAFMCVLVVWAGWGLMQTVTGGNVYDAQIAATPQLAPTLRPLGELAMFISILFYGLVAGGSVIVQGGAAIYYFSRRRHLDEFIRNTPDWAVAMLRATH